MAVFLGIDYGTKRIGLAISDDGATLAFPKGVIPNDANALKKIGDLIKEKKVSGITIGDSLNLKNQKNQLAGEIEIFMKKLEEKFHLPVNKEKEFFTSVEAKGRAGKEKKIARKTKQKKVGKVDDLAAALILQRYLDRVNNAIIKKR